MEAQQIRLHINELVNGIEDEAFLKACHEAVEGIAKAYRRVAGKSNGAKPPAKTARKTDAPAVPSGGEPGMEANAEAEKPLPHDLSLVFLANEVFKGSEPAPPEASVAFRRALLKSASKLPTLQNPL